MYTTHLAPGFFYMHHPTARITHTTIFVTPVAQHRLESAKRRSLTMWICNARGDGLRKRAGDADAEEVVQIFVHPVVVAEL